MGTRGTRGNKSIKIKQSITRKMRSDLNREVITSGALQGTATTVTNNSGYLHWSAIDQDIHLQIDTGTDITVSNTTLNNQNIMKQVKVGVFKVTRSEQTQKINSTQLLKEMWVEVKSNIDMKLLVASKLTKEDLQGTDLSELDIRELMTITFY
jgi:hypothetical protein